MTNDDLKILNTFLMTCHQMQNTGFGKMFSISPTKSYRLQQNTPRLAKFPRKFSHDEWQAFLIPFRKLTLNDDPANFNRVLNILSRAGSRKDQLRIREMKKNLKEAESSPGYGIQMLTEEDGSWVAVNGRETLNKYINSVVFHNNSEVIASGQLAKDMHVFSYGTMYHYVIFTYKQALRVAGAIRLRYGV